MNHQRTTTGHMLFWWWTILSNDAMLSVCLVLVEAYQAQKLGKIHQAKISSR